MDDGNRALETALGSVDDVGIRYLLRSRLKFREAGGDELGDVALLVAFGNRDGFIELAVLERTGHLLHEDAGLLASRTVHQGAVNHDSERINGKKKQDYDHGQRQ